MENELENRFKEIEEKDKCRLKTTEEKFRHDFEQIGKRIDDIQKYPSFIIAAVTAIIIGIGIFSAFNLNKEIDRLKQFKSDTLASLDSSYREMKDEIEATRNEVRNEIKASFERGIKLPDVILLSDIEIPLESQTLIANVLPPTKEGQKIRLQLSIIFKKRGLKI